MNAQPKLPWSLIRIVLMDVKPLQTQDSKYPQRSKREASQEVVIGPIHTCICIGCQDHNSEMMQVEVTSYAFVSNGDVCLKQYERERLRGLKWNAMISLGTYLCHNKEMSQLRIISIIPPKMTLQLRPFSLSQRGQL